jgi:hypothetical protein
MAKVKTIHKMGCVQISFSEIARLLVEQYAHNKVFDAEHVLALKEALNSHPFTLLTLDAKTSLSTAFFKKIRAVSSKDDLVIAICGSGPDEELALSLASLDFVRYIVLVSDYEKLEPLTPSDVVRL